MTFLQYGKFMYSYDQYLFLKIILYFLEHLQRFKRTFFYHSVISAQFYFSQICTKISTPLNTSKEGFTVTKARLLNTTVRYEEKINPYYVEVKGFIVKGM